jgi:hypothetical protein
MSRVRTRTHGSVGRRRLRPPLTRSLTALADAAIALSALRAFIFRGDSTTGVNSANLNAPIHQSPISAAIFIAA